MPGARPLRLLLCAQPRNNRQNGLRLLARRLAEPVTLCDELVVEAVSGHRRASTGCLRPLTTRRPCLIDAHPDSLRALPELAASCGMREGELFGIAFEDFDFVEKIVRVRRQVKRLGSTYVFALPKNDRERIVPLSDWDIEAVRRHTGKYPPRLYSPVGKARRETAYVQHPVPLAHRRPARQGP